MIWLSWALSLAPPAMAYVSTAGITWPQGKLMVQGIPGAKVPHITDAREPSLSPDQSRVLYWANPKDAKLENPIKELNLKTGKVRTVAPGNCRSPLWSADGKTILFTQYKKDWVLMSVPANASAKPRMVFSAGGLFHPTRSAQSDKVIVQDMNLVYWLTPEGKASATVPIASIASDPSAISSSDRFVSKPGNPQVIAYAQEANGDKNVVDEMTGMAGAVFTFDLHSGTRKRVTPASVYASDPQWSGDGKSIYFVAHLKNRTDIMSVPATGGKPRLVVKNAGEFSL